MVIEKACCEEIITHREQIKTVYNKVDEYKQDCKDKYDDAKKECKERYDEVKSEMGKIDTKIEGMKKTANTMVYSGFVFILGTIVNVGLDLLR